MPRNIAGQISLKIINAAAVHNAPQKVLDRYNRDWPSKISSAKEEMKGVIFDAIYNSKTADSLRFGVLKGEFGLTDILSAESVFNISDIVSQSIKTRFTRMKYVFPKVRGGLNIFVSADVYNKLLSSSFASYVSTNKDGAGSVIDWLEWLLLKGDIPIVTGYRVHFTQAVSAISRSGFAVMKEQEGAAYKVRGEFSGTLADNWLTRELQEPVFFNKIADILSKRLFS